MNQRMNIPAMQRIMAEFEKQNEIMSMKEEVMNDAIDDVMDEGDEEEETEGVFQAIMDELGIEFQGKVGAVQAPLEAPAQPDVNTAQEEDDLQARLNKLRNS
eukprot:304861_1